MNNKLKQTLIQLCNEYPVNRAFGDKGFACHGPTFHLFLRYHPDTTSDAYGLHLTYTTSDYDLLYREHSFYGPETLAKLPPRAVNRKGEISYKKAFEYDGRLDHEDVRILQLYKTMQDKVQQNEQKKKTIVR